MKLKKTRAARAGEDVGNAILGMVNLMYQNRTALSFLGGLSLIINNDLLRRIKIESERKKGKPTPDDL